MSNDYPQQVSGLTFDEVARVSLERCNRWHPGGIEEWSVSDWAVAMAGEAGEACNAVKKLRRIETGAANVNDPGRHLASVEAAKAAIGEELADTLAYAFLLAARIDIDLGHAFAVKFNSVSEKYGFPERLAVLTPSPKQRTID